MISQYTWPNFRGGSDREGTKIILDECKHSADVKYGHTKIFIRSPRTLFSLENYRNELIPGIVTLIQKTWRGYCARQYYKRLRAAYIIMGFYRRQKLIKYVNLLHKKFANAKSLPDYGKSIKWPAPPRSLKDTLIIIRKAYNRWRAYMILKKIPQAEWPQLKLKISAASVLRNKRSSWGQNRKWEGNYLSKLNENHNYSLFNESVNNLRNTMHFREVLFTSYVTKFNKFNKCAERVLLVTDKYIFKLDNTKFRNMKEGSEIATLNGIEISPGQDPLICLHCPGGNDLLISLHNSSNEDRIGELVGILCNSYYKLVHCFCFLCV